MADATVNELHVIEKIQADYAKYKKGFPTVEDIEPEELQSLLDSKAALVIVDVRLGAEQKVSMLPGAITKQRFEKELDSFKDHVVVTYCTIGARSGWFAAELKKKHVQMDVRNLRGSVLAWSHAGLPFEDPRSGKETKRVHVFGPAWRLAAQGYEQVVFSKPAFLWQGIKLMTCRTLSRIWHQSGTLLSLVVFPIKSITALLVAKRKEA